MVVLELVVLEVDVDDVAVVLAFCSMSLSIYVRADFNEGCSTPFSRSTIAAAGTFARRRSESSANDG